MANVFSVKVHIPAAIAVRNSSAVQGKLLSMAQAIVADAGAKGLGAGADVRPGRTRAHARAYIANDTDNKKNRENNALLKSMDAGRL